MTDAEAEAHIQRMCAGLLAHTSQMPSEADLDAVIRDLRSFQATPNLPQRMVTFLRLIERMTDDLAAYAASVRAVLALEHGPAPTPKHGV